MNANMNANMLLFTQNAQIHARLNWHNLHDTCIYINFVNSSLVRRHRLSLSVIHMGPALASSIACPIGVPIT